MTERQYSLSAVQQRTHVSNNLKKNVMWHLNSDSYVIWWWQMEIFLSACTESLIQILNTCVCTWMGAYVYVFGENNFLHSFYVDTVLLTYHCTFLFPCSWSCGVIQVPDPIGNNKLNMLSSLHVAILWFHAHSPALLEQESEQWDPVHLCL